MGKRSGLYNALVRPLLLAALALAGHLAREMLRDEAVEAKEQEAVVASQEALLLRDLEVNNRCGFFVAKLLNACGAWSLGGSGKLCRSSSRWSSLV